jgi:hypothetical protein
MVNYHFGIILLLMLLSCYKKSDTVLFDLPENTGINFRNDVTDGKLDNSFLFRNFYNGGGVAIGDLNNDGLADVFFTSNMGENKLYLNKGNFKFDDVSAKAGFKQDSMWSSGVVFADINNDGWLDIYVCNSGHMSTGNRRNKLYINNHDLTFTELASKYGLDHKGYTTQVSFFDFDLDGDLDCFIIDNSPIPVNQLGFNNKRDLPEKDWAIADFLKGGGNHLLRNDHGYFIEITQDAGIHSGLISFGLGVSVGDINNDGYPDIYISNDSYERDYLYINQKNGMFKDDFEECIRHTSFSSMGADIGDINNDGYPDIFNTDMLPDDDYRLLTTGGFDNIDLFNSKVQAGFYYQYIQNCLQLNDKNGRFLEIGNYSGVDASDWSWGALLFDMDNDGLNDIYVCNGVNRDVTDLDFMDFFANDVMQQMVLSGKKDNVDQILLKIPQTPLINKVFHNKNHLQFADESESWGLNQTSFSNGAAYGDLDNDGDLDLVVNNENQPSFVYRNNSRQHNKNHYIGVLLKGKGKNTFAIGSKIKIYKGNEVYYREVVPSRGFQSSVDYKQVIGLGKQTQVDSMIVVWPDRTYSKYERPELNKVYMLQQPEKKGDIYYSDEPVTETLVQPVKADFEKHTEDDYVDFYYERNLPEMLSKEGPQIAKGDVNGDGFEDVYIGGAKGQEGRLYLQTSKGFIRKEQGVFKRFADFEDVAVLFFDADKDGDFDLFIGAGGNNVAVNSRELQHRLYKNDGKGNFEIDAEAFPGNDMNISVAAANDFDTDGDLDLFVGARSLPFSYGATPSSYLYRNDGTGHFTDIARAMNQYISHAGMVTGAVWADIDGNSTKELIITGEWMATRIFSYNGKKFEEIKNTNLNELFGWWQTIAATDINGDGKQDLIIGNIGENFYLRPNASNPVKMWVNDFDQSGTTDQFLTRTVNGNDMPVFLKREVTDQFPGLKKQNLKHSDYAKKTVQQLFGNEIVSKSSIKKFNYCSSVIAVNNGKGSFTVQKLPAMVQLSTVNAVCVTDINNDNKPDLILGGNKFTFPPQLGRLDASYGDILINKGKGVLEWAEPKKTGLGLRAEVKDIEEIDGKDKRCILIVQNDQFPALYQLKR